MKRRRPSRHIRQVKTKNGKKKVLVNRDIPKQVSINKTDRKIFSHLSNPRKYSKEFGGGLDFNKKGSLEQIHIQKGKKYSIDLPADYEVLYHTHPSMRVDPPTPNDVIALLKSPKQQAEIVFRDGKAFTVIKTGKSKALSRLPTNQLFNRMDKAFHSFKGKNFQHNWKQHLDSLGLKTSINENTDSNLNIKIKPVE